MLSSSLAALTLSLATVGALAAPTNETNAIEKRLDFGVPGGWRKFGTSRLFAERNTIAINAFNRMIAFGGNHQSVGGLGYWQSANVWSALGIKDYWAKTNDFAGRTLDAVGDTFGQFPNFRQNKYNDDTLWWGTAAIYLSKAYNNPTALSWAQSTWTEVNKYVISGTSGNGKSFSWSGTCGGATMNGGVWWTNDPADDNINAITTGLFMTLSAYLYEATKQQQYLTAAVNARAFIKAHIWDSSKLLVLDTIHGKDCSTQPWVFTYNSGKYLEGLSVLYTATGDSQYLDAATNVAYGAIKNSPWQGTDGIITEGQNTPYTSNDDGRGFKSVLIRGLTEFYRRAPGGGQSQLQILIHSYIDTQANALIDLASNSPSAPTTYGVNWHGGFDGGYSWGQLAALDALGAFTLVNSP